MPNSTPKGTAKRTLYMTFIAYAEMILFTYFAFEMTRAVLGTLGNGRGASDSVKIMLAVAGFVFCILFALLGLYILKMSPTIYYYEDGFAVGKNGEKIHYQGLQYHLMPGSVPNKMIGIIYKADGKLKRLNAHMYASRAFDVFQQDVVESNLPQAMQKIENGETVEFRAVKPNKFGVTRIKGFDEKLENGIKIKVNKESISFDDEVYKWSEYTVISEYVGLIVVLDGATDRKVLTFAQNYMVEQPNVLTNIINILGGR